MRIKRFAIGALGVFLGTTLLWAVEPWKDKPYTEWTDKDIEKVLEDSPWGHAVMVQMEPRPNQPARRNRYVVQWASSLTVRQATARQHQLHDNLSEDQARQFVSAVPSEYILILRGRDLSELVPRIQQETAFVGRAIQYSNIQVSGNKQEIRPIKLQVAREGDRIVAALFYFPREIDGKSVIGPDENKVTFTFLPSFERPSKTMSTQEPIVVTFDLRKMMRDGKPDF